MRIVITIAGGYVQNVYTDGDPLEYIVLDDDLWPNGSMTIDLPDADGNPSELTWGAFPPVAAPADPDFVAAVFREVLR